MSTDYDDFESGPRARGDRPGPAPVNGPAVAALILGILSLGCLFITGLPAIICGFIGISKAGRIGKGKGMAVVGLLLGGFGTVVLTAGAVAFGIYSFGKLRDVSARMVATDNLQQVARATHSYHDTNMTLPPLNQRDNRMLAANNNLTPSEQLGWRFNVLPYLDHGGLYQMGNPAKAWDSAANSALIKTRVPTYSDRNDLDADTRYRVFVGPGAFYRETDKASPGSLLRVTDGTSNTIFVAEAAEKVEWPRNKELPFNANGSLPKLGRPDTDQFLVIMFDGSVRAIRKDADPNVIKKLITPRGGEVVDFDELD